MEMAPAGADFCGWGAKQGSRVRSWKNRYFVLRGRELAYYGGAARDGRGVDEKGRIFVTGVEYAPDLKNGLLVRGAKRNQVLRMTTTDAAQSRALFRKIKEALGESQASFRISAPLRAGMDMNGSPSSNTLDGLLRKKSAPGFVPPRAVSKSVMGAVEVTREGWLLKEEPELQTWKRRYVTLSGNVLTYYSSPTSMALESDVVQQVSRDFANPRALSIVAFGGRTVRLTGESRDDIAEWGAAVSRAIGESLPALLAAHSWKDGDAGGNERSERKITCHIEEESSSCRRRQYREGWLDKRGYKSGAWKQRYFLLADGMLEYRKHPTGEVCAENLVVDVNYSDENPDWLVISFASDSAYDENTLCVRAPSANETRRWMLALCDLVGKPALASPTEQPQRSLSSASSASSSSALSASPSDAAVALSSSPAPLPISDVQNTTQAPSHQQYEANNRAYVQVASSPVNQRASAAKSQIANDTGSRASQQGVIYRGWLLKKGQHFKTWKRRYFVLTRTTLVYYRTSNVKGAILGSGVVFDVAVGKERPFSLDVRFRNGRQLHIVAPTQEVFSMWHHALRVSSDLTESFINSRRGSTEAEVGPVADEFDNDVEEAENGGRDAEFTEADIAEYQSQLGTGAQLWAAAMKGMPLTEREYSWSSQVDGKEPDPAMEPDAAASSSSADGSGVNTTADQASESQPQGCQGWLMIEGDKLKSLQRRYCTLFGSKLSCYKSETSPLLQSLVVTAVKDWESVPFALRVSGEGGTELIIAAQSNQDYQKWWRALYASTLDQHERKTELKRAHSGDQRASSDGEIRSSTCSGWLEKEGRRFKTWKRRYFEFKNGALIYYSDVDGAVLGHGVVDHASVDSYKYNTLNIELDHGRTMRVTAADKSEMTRWLDALNKSRTASSATASLSDASEVHLDDVSVSEEGAGRPSAPVVEKRLDSSDYFANDTITDESYRRILSFEDNFSLIGTMDEAGLSFKGELTFGERVKAADGSRIDEVKDACDDEEDSGEDIMDTTNGVEYYRALVDEEALAKERRLAADEARASEMPPIHDCTGACCIVM